MTRIESTKCNKCISSGGGDCATCDPPGTTAKQNKEYIITEDQLKKYEGLFFLDDDAQEDFKTIRSRPHNSELKEEEKPGCFGHPSIYARAFLSCDRCAWFARCKQSREDF